MTESVVEAGTAEVGMAEVGMAEVGMAEVGMAEVGTAEVGTAEAGIVRDGRSAADLDAASPAAVSADGLAAGPARGMTDEQTDEVEEALRDVVDPELGVNIVDLGLVYDLALADEKLTIDMTLTSAACPLTDMIEDQISAALTGPDSTTSLVKDFTINWVWLPPWGPERITDDGRDQLRALGFNI